MLIKVLLYNYKLFDYKTYIPYSITDNDKF